MDCNQGSFQSSEIDYVGDLDSLEELSLLNGNDSLLLVELKTKEEGGIVLIRRSLGLTGPRSKTLHVGSFISFVFLVFNWQQFSDKKLVICSDLCTLH